MPASDVTTGTTVPGFSPATTLSRSPISASIVERVSAETWRLR